MGVISSDANRQSEMAISYVSQVYGEEDNWSIKGDAWLCAATAIPPEARGVGGGEVGVKSDVEFI